MKSKELLPCLTIDKGLTSQVLLENPSKESLCRLNCKHYNIISMHTCTLIQRQAHTLKNRQDNFHTFLHVFLQSFRDSKLLAFPPQPP